MNKLGVAHIFTALFLILVQILICRNVQIEIFGRYVMTILVYPGALLFIPIGIRVAPTLIAAFVIGLIVDVFYDSPGVHAGALVFTAFMRPLVLRWVEPRQKYRLDANPTFGMMGTSWMVTYTAILLLIHCLLYFALDAFTFVFFDKILISSISTFALSFILIMMYKSLAR